MSDVEQELERSGAPTNESVAGTEVDANDGGETAQKERQSSKQRRLEYLKNGIDSDCELHVQSTCADADLQKGNVCYRIFRCHRLFLSTASDKLEQDVYQNKHWNGVLQINGVSPEAVESFLEYIYTFEITSTHVQLSQIGDMFILACAYNMPELLVTYAEQLKDIEWPMEYIFPTFDLAYRHKIYDLEHVCMVKILEHATELAEQPSLMKIQIYALNYVIQHWMVSELVPSTQIIQLLQKYQQENDINFNNKQKFPHFIKIIKYFPNVMLDAEGLIVKY